MFAWARHYTLGLCLLRVTVVIWQHYRAAYRDNYLWCEQQIQQSQDRLVCTERCVNSKHNSESIQSNVNFNFVRCMSVTHIRML